MARGGALKEKGRSTWRARWELPPDPKTGNRRQRSRGGFGSKAEAEKYAAEQVGKIWRGNVADSKGLTFAKYAEQWLEAIKPIRGAAGRQIRMTTWYGYDLHVRKYMIPALGKVKLRDLTRDQVLYYLNHDAPPSMRNQIHGTLRNLGFAALHEGLIPSNPAAKLGKGRIQSPNAGIGLQVWEFDQLAQFLKAADGHRYFALWHVLAGTGCRKGEALGLFWSDVELDNGYLTIQRGLVQQPYNWLEEPKTAAGRRRVEIEPSIVDALRLWKTIQRHERMAAGAEWKTTVELVDGRHIPNDMVFTRPDGGHPADVSNMFHKLVKAAGLPPIRLHDLRHTHATLLLKGGENARVVQARIGHADVSTTLRVYSHMPPSMGRRASTWFEEQLAAAAKKKPEAEAAESGEQMGTVTPFRRPAKKAQ